MAKQCKVPINKREPNINICVEEKGHEGPHKTYGLGWNLITYTSPVKPRDPIDLVVTLCMEAEEQWKKHPFNHEMNPEVDQEDHRPCETGSRVVFARRVMSALGFCIKCGESMPCTNCGAGL